LIDLCAVKATFEAIFFSICKTKTLANPAKAPCRAHIATNAGKKLLPEK
jgi:hypothetical protein